MSNLAETTPRDQESAAFKTAILSSQPSNPALQRLKARVLSASDASAVITSYDRMHHRHSRTPR
ncbi:MAG: YhhA family cyclophane-containing RiPP [Terricaulis sp.]